MESPEATPTSIKSTGAKILTGLTVIGISLSICNELSTLPWQTPGWALLTRTLHAWLGLGALLWVLFRYKPGLWMLVIWILTSAPIIATDPSGNWTETIWEINTTTESWTRDNGGMIAPYYSDLSRRGINYSPILIAIWFIIAAKRRAFPALQPPKNSRHPMQLCNLLIVGGTLLGITHAATRILNAPLVLWGSTPEIQFYYKDQLLGTQRLILDAKLMDTIGLDSQQPEKAWEMVKHYYAPFGQGIYLTDGHDWARIDTYEPSSIHNDINIATPWGTRTSIQNRNHNSQFDWIKEFAPRHNPKFHITITPSTDSAKVRETVSLNVRIDPLSNRIDFSEAKMRVTFRNLAPNGDNPKSMPRKTHKIPTPEGLYDLKDGVAEFTIEVNAPDQAGNYSIYIPSICFYDENGDDLEPIRKANQSDQSLITIEANPTDG